MSAARRVTSMSPIRGQRNSGNKIKIMVLQVAWARMLGAQALKAHERWHEQARALERAMVMEQRERARSKRMSQEKAKSVANGNGKALSMVRGQGKARVLSAPRERERKRPRSTKIGPMTHE